MTLQWITSFSNKNIHAPFVIARDADYYDDLRKRLTFFVKTLKEVSADKESIEIARKYADRICDAVVEYYKGRISTCHKKIENLIRDCNNHELAVSELSRSRVFPGVKSSEIQFFRARTLPDAKTLKPKEMLHVPFSQRGKSGNYRFSIPGVSSLYLANSSYGCWIEMGKPSDHDFYVSPVVLDRKQKIFNLAVMSRLLDELNDGDEAYVHCWIKLLVMMIATSYRIEEEGRSFRSEYIVSQSIMLACKKLGYDGVAYFSKRTESELLSFASINVALFAEYERKADYGSICRHLKIDEPMNYQFFRQLDNAATYQHYPLRVDRTGFPTNINGFLRQYSYRDTEFHRFDEHLFGRWEDKDRIRWGNALTEE